jgi:hypothetical protein
MCEQQVAQALSHVVPSDTKALDLVRVRVPFEHGHNVRGCCARVNHEASLEACSMPSM